MQDINMTILNWINLFVITGDEWRINATFFMRINKSNGIDMYNGLHRTLKFDKSHPPKLFFEAKIIIFMEGYYFSSTDPRTIRIATHAAKMFKKSGAVRRTGNAD